MPYTSLTPAKYAQQLKATASYPQDPTAHDTAPWADSPEDVITRTVQLDGGAAVVEHAEDRVEVTIRLGGRTVLGIALSHMEAANLGRAIASPAGATTGDLFHLADELGIDASDIMRLQNRAVIS